VKYSRKVRLIKLKSSRKYQRLLNKDMGSFGIKSGHVILKKGENIGTHSTDSREELIIVLKGKGQARIGKNRILNIDRDKVLYIPPYTLHDIRNTGSRILEYIFIHSRPPKSRAERGKNRALWFDKLTIP
jgi:mannose-6-phosphate isomerase-like protein (cupin superfamily)